MILRLETDYAQQRISAERQATVVDGHSWNLTTVDKVWVEPETLTAMLRPNVFDPEFDTTFSGRYARMRLSEFLAGSPGGWIETVGGKGAGDYWIESIGATQDFLITSSPLEQDQGFYVAWYAFNPNTSESATAFTCGYVKGSPGTITERFLTFRFRSGGKVEVFEGNEFVREYSLSFQPKEQPDNQDVDADDEAELLTQDFAAVAIIPFRNREVLVVSSSGASFTHVLRNLPEDWQGEIIPAGWRFGVGFENTSAKFQAVRINYPSQGVIYGQDTLFLRPPPAGADVVKRAVFHPPSASVTAQLVDMDGNVFVPDDTKDTARLKFTLDAMGGGTRTPFLYGGEGYVRPTLTATPDEAFDITGSVTSLTLEASDEDPSARITLSVVDPESLEPDVPKIGTVTSRPLRLQVLKSGAPPTWETWWEGVLADPEVEHKVTAKAERVRFVCPDIYTFAENYMMPDIVPLDGMELSAAIAELAEVVGIDVEAPPTGFTIPAVGLNGGDFQNFVEVGETVADGIKRLRESHAGNFLMVMMPTSTGYVLRFEESPSASPVKTLYATRAEAQAANAPADDVFRERRDSILPTAATHIWIQGRDPHTGKPILATVRMASEPEKPDVPKATRGDEWTGFPRRYGYSDTALVSTSLLRRAAEILAKRIFTRRQRVSFTSGVLIKDDGLPVWIGDVVRLSEGGVTTDVRIRSMNLRWLKTASETPPGHVQFEQSDGVYEGEVVS